MIPDSLAPGIVIWAPDKTSARESGDEATNTIVRNISLTPTPSLVSRSQTPPLFISTGGEGFGEIAHKQWCQAYAHVFPTSN